MLGGKANDPGPPGPPEPVLVEWRKPIPILMYHAVSMPRAESAAPELFVKPLRFRRQMERLRAEGYNAITLKQAYEAWTAGERVPKKPIIVSFDDGYRGHHTDALPILSELGWPGVLNLSLRNLDNGEITEEMVQDMIDAGWQIDSHSITHPDLTSLDRKALREQVAGSRARLEELFDVPIEFFCYPAGKFDRKVVAEVRRAGYLGATTTIPGLAGPKGLFRLKRIRINGSDGVPGMVAKLEAAG